MLFLHASFQLIDMGIIYTFEHVWFIIYVDYMLLLQHINMKGIK